MSNFTFHYFIDLIHSSTSADDHKSINPHGSDPIEQSDKEEYEIIDFFGIVKIESY